MPGVRRRVCLSERKLWGVGQTVVRDVLEIGDSEVKPPLRRTALLSVLVTPFSVAGLTTFFVGHRTT